MAAKLPGRSFLRMQLASAGIEKLASLDEEGENGFLQW
jgi:hypothetical protein